MWRSYLSERKDAAHLMRQNQSITLLGDDFKHVNEKIITLAPGNARSIGLGTFTSLGPEPCYEVTFVPDVQDAMGFSQEKLPMDPQKYMLLYQFHNFGQKPCTITMRWRGEDPSIKE